MLILQMRKLRPQLALGKTELQSLSLWLHHLCSGHYIIFLKKPLSFPCLLWFTFHVCVCVCVCVCVWCVLELSGCAWRRKGGLSFCIRAVIWLLI